MTLAPQPAATHTLRQRVSSYLLMSGIALLSVFPINVLLPSFSALAQRFNVPIADITLSISVFTLVFSVSQLLVGPLSDRWGRKPLLLATLALSLLGALGCALSNSYAQFLFFRGVQAVGCGLFVLGHALVEDLFARQQRAQVRNFYLTLSGFFIAIAPLLGSVLQDHFDWPASFYLFGLIAAVIFLHVQLALDSHSQRPVPHPSLMQTVLTLISHRDFMGYWLIASLTFACYFAVISVTPQIFMVQLKLSPNQYAWLLMFYGAAYVLGGMLAAKLQKHLPTRIQIILGLLVLAFSGVLLILILVSDRLSVASLLSTFSLSAVGVTLVRPAAISAAMSLFSDKAGTAASTGNTLMFATAAASSAALAYSGTFLLLNIAVGFIVLSLLGVAITVRITQ